jgi:hypothetical protein
MSKPWPVVAGLRRRTWTLSTPEPRGGWLSAARPVITWWPASRPGYEGDIEAAPQRRRPPAKPARRYRRGRIQFALTA